jgi:hypothetical protein
VAMMKILKSKKGMYYLFLSIVLVAVLIVVFLMQEQYSFSDSQKSQHVRIRTVNDFLENIESDSKRSIFISGFRAFIALEDYVASTGSYQPNSEEIFKELFYYGRINSSYPEIMVNSSYSDYIDKLNYIAGKKGIVMDFNVTEINFYHDSPWSINVVVSAKINVSDAKGLASWNFEKDYQTSVSLENIRDPVYSVATFGRVPNTIRKTNVTDFVNGNNTDGFMTHVNNSYYVENSLAPSFLMRLKGNFSSSPYGIESLVNTKELQIQDVDYSSSKSIVDYVLFTNVTGYDNVSCSFDYLPSEIKLDANHTSFYEVNGLNPGSC